MAFAKRPAYTPATSLTVGDVLTCGTITNIENGTRNGMPTLKITYRNVMGYLWEFLVGADADVYDINKGTAGRGTHKRVS